MTPLPLQIIIVVICLEKQCSMKGDAGSEATSEWLKLLEKQTYQEEHDQQVYWLLGVESNSEDLPEKVKELQRM